MQYRNESITARNGSVVTIPQYSLVKLLDTPDATEEIVDIQMTSSGSDTAIGVTMENCAVGDLVAVRLIGSGGLLPCRLSPGQRDPGTGMTIGQGVPGALSANADPLYDRKVAYVVGTGDVTSPGDVIGVVLFTRTHYSASI